MTASQTETNQLINEMMKTDHAVIPVIDMFQLILSVYQLLSFFSFFCFQLKKDYKVTSKAKSHSIVIVLSIVMAA